MYIHKHMYIGFSHADPTDRLIVKRKSPKLKVICKTLSVFMVEANWFDIKIEDEKGTCKEIHLVLE